MIKSWIPLNSPDEFCTYVLLKTPTKGLVSSFQDPARVDCLDSDYSVSSRISCTWIISERMNKKSFFYFFGHQNKMALVYIFCVSQSCGGIVV